MQGMVIVEWTEQCGSSLIQTDEELLEQEGERERERERGGGSRRRRSSFYIGERENAYEV
jgi:hypothetical protein